VHPEKSRHGKDKNRNLEEKKAKLEGGGEGSAIYNPITIKKFLKGKEKKVENLNRERGRNGGGGVAGKT